MTSQTTTPDTSAAHLRALRILLTVARMDAGDIRRASRRHQTPGAIAWAAMSGSCDPDDPRVALDGWPECECSSGQCSEPATRTDDGGTPVCDACADYAVDEDGDVHCASCDSGDVEQVTETCGAGGQTRSYFRLRPPAMPEVDPEGEWGVWWDTVGDDAHLVSRHTTRAAAEQAIAAHDWPRPGDHTQYLCGYGVRHLIDGEWLSDGDR